MNRIQRLLLSWLAPVLKLGLTSDNIRAVATRIHAMPTHGRFTRDVTDRRSAAELAERLADIVEYSNDAIISQDLDGRINSWNPAAERMYGYSAAEANGQSIRLIIPPGREHEADVVRRVREGERVPSFDTVRRRKCRSGEGRVRAHARRTLSGGSKCAGWRP